MANKEKNFASALIYVHNAEERVGNFLKMVIGVMEENFEHSEIICVNDYSTDNSKQEIKKASAEAVTTSVSVVSLSYFHGLEVAMKAGIDLSIGDFVFEFDSTVQDFDPDQIMRIYRRSLEGYDIVSASPDRKERFSSHLFYRIFEKYAKVTTHMTTESFRVLSRRVINRISDMNRTVPYRKVIYSSAGLKTDNVKYHPKQNPVLKRDKGEKKYRPRLAIDSLILFTDLGYRVSSIMAGMMAVVSILMIVYSLVVYFISQPVAGWTTTILFIAIAFFGLFVVQTVIIKYLQILLDLVFKRKHYSFESIEKLTK